MLLNNNRRKMKKFLGLIPMIVLSGFTLQAQSYIELSVDTAYATGDPVEIHKATVTVTNTGTQAQSMTWLRTKNEKPAEWETSVCDPNLCWAPFADAPGYGWNQEPDGSIEFYVQFDGRNIPDAAVPGHGEVEITIYSEADSANYNAFGVFIADLGATGFYSPSMDQVFEVYPNPAINDLTVMASYSSDIEQIQIVNLVGKTVLLQNWNNGTGKMTVDIRDLPEGIYFVQFIGKDKVLKTKKISISR
jgi:hypothetical protein